MTYEEILSDANNLYRAYKASVKGSKWKETTQKFMMNFLRYIFSIQEDLLNRTLENGPVEEFSLSERGRVRPISSIRIRDRIVRHMNLSKEELVDLLEHIRVIAKELGIHINEKKTRIVKISSTYKFLQVKYTLTKDGKIVKRINPDRVTTMRRKLKKLAIKVANGEIPYENIENMFRGWMGSFYKLLSRQRMKTCLIRRFQLLGKSLLYLIRRNK